MAKNSKKLNYFTSSKTVQMYKIKRNLATCVNKEHWSKNKYLKTQYKIKLYPQTYNIN